MSVFGSCRVCGINQQDGECESFVNLLESDQTTPSDSGYLYVELMDLPILADNIDNSAILLCYSCDLQMKLFKKLKEKARRTMLIMEKCFQKQFNELSNAKQEINDEYSVSIPKISNNADFIVEYLDNESNLYVQIEDSNDDYTDLQILDENNNDDDYNEYNGYEQPATNCKNSTVVTDKTYSQRGYDCPCCHQHFNKRDEFRLHRENIHGNKYPCTECTKIFSTADALRVHMKLHSTEAPKYKCELCGSTFNQKVHLKYHINRHNNVRRFHCKECNKAFLSKSDLNIHIRTHTGEKRFSCSVCGKKFLLHQHLKMHSYSHNLEKEFECDVCKYRFISPVTLKAHMQNMHSELKFECEFCGRKFRRKRNLKLHYKVHEKNMFGPICEEEVTEQMYELHSRLQKEFTDDIVTEETDDLPILEENLYIMEEENTDHVDDYFVIYDDN